MSEGAGRSAFWDWAIKVYTAEAVSAFCLELQDDHGHCVPLLLWGMWQGTKGLTLEVQTCDEAVEVARAYHEHVIAPLRAIRRKLKSAVSDMEDQHRMSLRDDIKGLELKSETALMQALEALPVMAGQTGASRPIDEAERLMSANLIALARAWNPVVARPRLLALSAATASALRE